MTQPNLRRLHDDCAKALHEYTKAATTLCKLLGELADGTPTLEDRDRILTQRTIENSLFQQYYEIRSRLLNAATAGFGDL